MLALARGLLAFLWLGVCAAIGSVFALIRFRNVNTLHPVAHIFARGCDLMLGVRVVKRGYEKLLRQDSYIIIANHQHSLDVPIFARMVPPRTITIGKKQVMYIPFFNIIFYATGNLLIDRKNLEQAKRVYQHASRMMREKGARFWLFPEGTRRYGIGVGPFKKGPFHLAIETGASLQPIVSSSYAGNVNLNHWKAGTVIIEVLPPIEVKGRDVDAIIEEAHSVMKTAHERLNAEVKQNA
jgi:1-acyl-sn-glycerol-3-phosphate acyltransferase